MTALVFRVVAGVVNGAACAVNHLLEVMYPKDIGHIWEDVPAGSVASGGPAPTGPTPGAAADSTESATPPALSVGSLTWFGWCYPAIVEALAAHGWRPQGTAASVSKCRCGSEMYDEFEWRDHVSVVIADRIGCDPARAIAALQNLQTQE